MASTPTAAVGKGKVVRTSEHEKYGGVGVKLHRFLTSALAGVVWADSNYGRLMLCEGSRNLLIRCWVGLTADLEAIRKIKTC
jgi:hypothetical protein